MVGQAKISLIKIKALPWGMVAVCDPRYLHPFSVVRSSARLSTLSIMAGPP
jgi:hypothetical protein